MPKTTFVMLSLSKHLAFKILWLALFAQDDIQNAQACHFERVGTGVPDRPVCGPSGGRSLRFLLN